MRAAPARLRAPRMLGCGSGGEGAPWERRLEVGGRRRAAWEEGTPGIGEIGVGGELGEWRRKDAP